MELVDSDIPCVLIDSSIKGKETITISCDNVKASYDAVNYLIQHNHNKIAVLNGRKEATITADRFQGYVNALSEAGIPLNKKFIHYCDFQEDIAYDTTLKIMKDSPEITAIFCASDMMAVGALKALQFLGIKVPEQVSLVGFDDIPLAEIGRASCRERV